MQKHTWEKIISEATKNYQLLQAVETENPGEKQKTAGETKSHLFQQRDWRVSVRRSYIMIGLL